MTSNRHRSKLAIEVLLLSLFFGFLLFTFSYGAMFVADMLTPNGQGVLSVQVESLPPFFHAVLVGLFAVGRIPSSLCLFSIILAVSVVLFVSRRKWLTRAAIICLAVACLVGSSLWVPNPFVRWPISILGDHDDRQLIRELFPVHVVNPDWITSGGMDITGRWCIAEAMARGVLVAGMWSVALLVIARLTRPKEAANKQMQVLVGKPGSS